MREDRWVIIDLCGKGSRIGTVAVPLWVKQGINAWMTAAQIDEGRLFRSVKKGGKKIGESPGDWAVWSVVEQSAKRIGIERFGAHDFAPNVCQALPQERRGSGADQIPAGALVDPDDGGDRRQRQSWALRGRQCEAAMWRPLPFTSGRWRGWRERPPPPASRGHTEGEARRRLHLYMMTLGKGAGPGGLAPAWV